MNDKVKAAAAAKRTMVFGVISGALIALYGLWISRSHITHIGYALGLNTSEAETLFVFIDFIAIYGKMLTSKRLTAKTRRIGYRFLIFGGVASLACNVASGALLGQPGAAVYGAFIVGIVAALEYAIANTKAKTVVKPRTRAVTPASLTTRQIGARKAAATRKANALAAAAASDPLENAYALPAVTPAPANVA